MEKERITALLRELRKAASDLPAGKRNEVVNKLDRVGLIFKRTKDEPETKKPYGPEGFTGPEQMAEYGKQTRAILAYMQDGHTITGLEALRLFGVMCLPRRIADIEEMTGVAPKRRRIQVQKASGKKVYVAEYWWEETN